MFQELIPYFLTISKADVFNYGSIAEPSEKLAIEKNKKQKKKIPQLHPSSIELISILGDGPCQSVLLISPAYDLTLLPVSCLQINI